MRVSGDGRWTPTGVKRALVQASVWFKLMLMGKRHVFCPREAHLMYPAVAPRPDRSARTAPLTPETAHGMAYPGSSTRMSEDLGHLSSITLHRLGSEVDFASACIRQRPEEACPYQPLATMPCRYPAYRRAKRGLA